MSIIQVVNHNETIYKILDQPPPEPPKTPRYESKLERQLKELKIVPCHRTFGFAETPLKPPTKYLKKGEGLGQPLKTSEHTCYMTGKLPPVPKRPSPENKIVKPVVNFKVINIKKVLKGKGKAVEPRLVDTRDGHIKKIKGSGEVPEYCLREDFGRLPKYLVKRNRMNLKRIERLREAEENKESLCKLISEDERQHLLNDLKHNWQLMQKAFLQLPMLTDTIPKILRKTKMEKELRELEKDISLVEANPFIYIYK